MLGHSFTSANGADNGSLWYRDEDSYQPESTGGSHPCFRSVQAAGVQAAQQLGMSLIDAACAGATPANIYPTPQYDEGVQLAWLPSTSSAVVLGERGNPEFSQAITKVFDPTQDPRVRCIPQGLSATDCAVPMFDDQINAYKGEEGQVQAIYDGIRAKNATARIFAIGIPRWVVPRPGDEIMQRCGAFLAPEEVAPLGHMIDALNDMIREAAIRNGAIFVDVNTPDSPGMQGRHDLCSADAWLWGPRALIPPNDQELLNPEMWFTAAMHPTIAANNAMAGSLIRAMLDNPPNQ
jgi:hypothetical protein